MKPSKVGQPEESAIGSKAEKAVEAYLRLATHQMEALDSREAIERDLAHVGGIVHALGKALDHTDVRARVLAASKIIEIGVGQPGQIDAAMVRRAEAVTAEAIRVSECDDKAWGCSLFTSRPATPLVVEAIQEQLECDDVRVRVLAASALLHLSEADDAVLKVLENAISEKDPLILAIVADAVSQLGMRVDWLTPKLLGALPDLDPCGQRSVFECLESFNPVTEELVKFLCDIVDDEDIAVRFRAAAAKTLGAVTKRTDRALPTLYRALNSQEIELFYASVAGVEKTEVDSGEAADLLISRLSNDDEKWRLAAARALATLRPSSADIPRILNHARSESSPNIIEAMADALVAAGPTSIPFAVDIIRLRDYQLCPIAGMVLLLLPEEGATAIAAALMTETDEYSIAMLLSHVAILGPSAAKVVPSMAAILDNAENDELANHIAKAIGSLGILATQASEALVRCLLRRGERPARSAEAALKNIGLDALDALDKAVLSDSLERRSWIDRLIGEILSGADAEFLEYDAFGKDQTLELFLHIAEGMDKHKTSSLRRLARIFTRLQDSGEFHMSCSHSKLVGAVRELEKTFGPLTQRKKGKSGPLNEDARKRVPAIKRYLSLKRRRKGKQTQP